MDIELYEKDNGSIPVSDFLDSLSPKLKAKTIRTIELLKTYGSNLREPYSKYLNDGIYELRTKQSSNITRILYFFVIGDKAILTNGYIKKSGKISIRELLLAKKYMSDYKRRNI